MKAMSETREEQKPADQNSASPLCSASYEFEACDELGECDKCHVTAKVWFGDRDYWDSREGRCLCQPCLDARINADIEYAKQFDV